MLIDLRILAFFGLALSCVHAEDPETSSTKAARDSEQLHAAPPRDPSPIAPQESPSTPSGTPSESTSGASNSKTIAQGSSDTSNGPNAGGATPDANAESNDSDPVQQFCDGEFYERDRMFVTGLMGSAECMARLGADGERAYRELARSVFHDGVSHSRYEWIASSWGFVRAITFVSSNSKVSPKERTAFQNAIESERQESARLTQPGTVKDLAYKSLATLKERECLSFKASVQIFEFGYACGVLNAQRHERAFKIQFLKTCVELRPKMTEACNGAVDGAYQQYRDSFKS